MESPPPSEAARHIPTQRQEAAVELGRRAVGPGDADPGSDVPQRTIGPGDRRRTVSTSALRDRFVGRHGDDNPGDAHLDETSRCSRTPRLAGDHDE